MNTTTDTKTDAELLQQYIKGSEEAFTALAHRYAGLVLGRCQRLLGTEEAEDASQAVFLILARKADSIRRGKALASWLMSVATRVCLTALQKKSKQAQAEKEIAMVLENKKDQPDALWPEIRPEIDAVLDSLPKREREAVVLHYLCGRSQVDIAAEWGCPKSTVCSRIQRGIGRIRKKLLKKGIVLSVPVIGTVLGKNCIAQASPSFVMSLSQLGAQAAALGSIAAAGTAVSALVQGALKMMLWAKIKAAAGIAAAVLAAGIFTPFMINTFQDREKETADIQPRDTQPSDIKETTRQSDSIVIVPDSSDAWAVFSALREKGIDVFVMGEQRKLFVPADFLYKPVEYRTLVNGIAAFNQIQASWYTNQTKAVLYRGVSDTVIENIKRGLASEDKTAYYQAVWDAGWINDIRVIPLVLEAALKEHRSGNCPFYQGSAEMWSVPFRSLDRLGWKTIAAVEGEKCLPVLKLIKRHFLFYTDSAADLRRRRGIGMIRQALLLRQAQEAAAITGSEKAPAFIEEILLKTQDIYFFQRSYSALSALGRIKTDKVLSLLKACLGNPNPYIREEAVKALAIRGGIQAYKLLEEALDDPEKTVRDYAADILAQSGTSEASLIIEKGIEEGLESSDNREQIQAYSCMKYLEEEKALSYFRRGLQDQDPSIRRTAAYNAALYKGKGSITLIKELLNHDDKDVRASAASALGSSPGPEAVNLLETALKDSDNAVVRNAVRSLGKKGNERSLHVLEGLFAHSDTAVRKEAVSAVGNTGGEKALQILEKACSSTDEDIRMSAVLAAGQIEHDRAYRILERGLHDQDQKIRDKAVQALCKKQTAKAHSVIENLLQADNGDNPAYTAVVMNAGVHGLSSPRILGPGELLIFRKALMSQDWKLRSRAVNVLCRIGGWPALKFLSQAVFDDNHDMVRLDAVRYLKGLGSAAHGIVVPVLVRALQDRSQWVRDEAVRGILELSLNGDKGAQASLEYVLGQNQLKNILFREVKLKKGDEALDILKKSLANPDENVLKNPVVSIMAFGKKDDTDKTSCIELAKAEASEPEKQESLQNVKLLTKDEFLEQYRLRRSRRPEETSGTEQVKNENEDLNAEELMNRASADSKDWKGKIGALEELAKRIKKGDREAYKAFDKLLSMNDQYCSSQGIRMLCWNGGDPALPLVEKSLQDQDKYGRIRVIINLRDKTESVRDLLIKYIKQETDPKMREIGIKRLEFMFKNDPAAQEFLKTLPKKEEKPEKKETSTKTELEKPEDNTGNDIF